MKLIAEQIFLHKPGCVFFDYATDIYTDADVADKTTTLAVMIQDFWTDRHPTDTAEYDWQAIATTYLKAAAKHVG